MNKEVKELKSILRLHGVRLYKPPGEWVVRILIEGINKDLIYLAPECEDGDFLRAEDVEDFNKIVHFEINFEEFHSQDEQQLKKYLSAATIAIETLIEFNKEWTGKDFRDFAKLNIDFKR